MNTEQMAKYSEAYHHGHAARMAGDSLDKNPYRLHYSGGEVEPAWYLGWRDGWNAAEDGVIDPVPEDVELSGVY